MLLSDLPGMKLAETARRRRSRYLILLAIPTVFWLVSFTSYGRPYRDLVHEQFRTRFKASLTVLRGSSWDAHMHNMLAPTCPAGQPVTKKYIRGRIKSVALTSFPRSGNSYTRSLIERATGFQTSSLYCDKRLLRAFHAECDGWDNPWVIKNHWPAGKKLEKNGLWQHFDKALVLVRNPIDVAWSLYNLEKTSTHNRRLKGYRFGKKDHKHLKLYADILAQHTAYWLQDAKIQTHVIRYEDMRKHTMTETMSMLNFLLPTADLPSLERIACAVEDDPEKDAYRSHKYETFYAWNKFEPETRDYYLELVKDTWCKFGYDLLLQDTLGVAAIDCKSNTPMDSALTQRDLLIFERIAANTSMTT